MHNLTKIKSTLETFVFSTAPWDERSWEGATCMELLEKAVSECQEKDKAQALVADFDSWAMQDIPLAEREQMFPMWWAQWEALPWLPGDAEKNSQSNHNPPTRNEAGSNADHNPMKIPSALLDRLEQRWWSDDRYLSQFAHARDYRRALEQLGRWGVQRYRLAPLCHSTMPWLKFHLKCISAMDFMSDPADAHTIFLEYQAAWQKMRQELERL